MNMNVGDRLLNISPTQRCVGVCLCVCLCVCACVCVFSHLLQGAEQGPGAGVVQAAVGEAQGRKVSQSQVLRQQQALDQAGLLTLPQKGCHLRAQGQL